MKKVLLKVIRQIEIDFNGLLEGGTDLYYDNIDKLKEGLDSTIKYAFENLENELEELENEIMSLMDMKDEYNGYPDSYWADEDEHTLKAKLYEYKELSGKDFNQR